MPPGVQLPGFKPQLHYLSYVTWGQSLTSFCLSFFICKMEAAWCSGYVTVMRNEEQSEGWKAGYVSVGYYYTIGIYWVIVAKLLATGGLVFKVIVTEHHGLDHLK